MLVSDGEHVFLIDNSCRFFPFFPRRSLFWARVICCFRFSLSHCRWLVDRLLIRFSPLMCYFSICGFGNRLFLWRIMERKRKKKQRNSCARDEQTLLSKNPFRNLMGNFLFVRLARWIGTNINKLGLAKYPNKHLHLCFRAFFLLSNPHSRLYSNTFKMKWVLQMYIHWTQMFITHITPYAIFLYLLQFSFRTQFPVAVIYFIIILSLFAFSIFFVAPKRNVVPHTQNHQPECWCAS